MLSSIKASIYLLLNCTIKSEIFFQEVGDRILFLTLFLKTTFLLLIFSLQSVIQRQYFSKVSKFSLRLWQGTLSRTPLTSYRGRNWTTLLVEHYPKSISPPNLSKSSYQTSINQLYARIIIDNMDYSPELTKINLISFLKLLQKIRIIIPDVECNIIKTPRLINQVIKKKYRQTPMLSKDPKPTLAISLLILLLMPLLQGCTNNSSGCVTCLNSNTCSQCMDGYYINGAGCFACYTICKTCSGYFDCQSCYPGNYWDSTYLWCYKCPTGCSTCTSSSCSTCAANYYLSSGSCQHCGAACTLCMDNVGCTTCPSGNYPQNNTCLSCPAACSSCTNPTNCQSCNGGYYLQGSSCLYCTTGCNSCTSNQTCTNCIMNYYMKSGVCYSCGINCNSCSNNVGCIQCSLSNMFIQNQTCVFCPSQCTACSNSSSCSHCAMGYYLNNSNCLSCGSNCASCSDIIGCTACSVNYYLSGGNCLSCGGYCSICVAGSGCTQCSILNMYISSQSCHFCPSGCRACDSQLVCTSCDSGYEKSNSDCVLKQVGSPVQTPITVITIIAIVVPILLAIIIAIIIYIYCCRARTVPPQDKNTDKSVKVEEPSFQAIKPDYGRNVTPFMPSDEIESVADPRIEQKVDPKADIEWVKVDFRHLREKFPCELCKNERRGIVVTSCGHVFHPQCLETYMDKYKKCPKCPLKSHKNFCSICENCNQFGYKQLLPEIKSRAFKKEHHCRPFS